MKTKRTKTYPFVLLLVVIFLVFLAVSFTSCIYTVEYLEGPDEIREVVLAEENRDELYAVDYLKDWNFLPVTRSKFQGIEIVFRDYYVKGKALPSAYELAKETVFLFLDHFYTLVDLENESEVTDALITCYVEAVGDPYAVYRTAKEYDDYDTDMSGSYVGIGVTVEYDSMERVYTVSEVHDGSGAKAVGILPGDRIIGVGGVYIEDSDAYSDVLDSIRGEAGTTVVINIDRSGTELSFEVERKALTEMSVKYSILEGNVGYVRITSFKENTDEQFKSAIDALEAAGVKGVIYDLRGNLGGYLSSVVNMLSYIAPKGTEIVSFSNNYDDPMKSDSDHTFTVPSVVICNGRTASAGELFTSAIRDFSEMGILEAKLVGETTFGKGVMQSSKPFTDGSVITLTVAYYYPPLGSDYGYDGEGIIPDETVEAGEGDEDLQYIKAIEVINELIK